MRATTASESERALAKGCAIGNALANLLGNENATVTQTANHDVTENACYLCFSTIDVKAKPCGDDSEDR